MEKSPAQIPYLSGIEFAGWLLACVVLCAVAWTAHALTPAQAPVASIRLNMNTASLEDLIALPGMNFSRARAILKAREKSGRFENLKALINATGMTPAYVKRVEELIEVK